jgi:hypothetical protein
MVEKPQSGVEPVHNKMREPAWHVAIHLIDISNANEYLVFDISE